VILLIEMVNIYNYIIYFDYLNKNIKLILKYIDILTTVINFT